MRLHFGAVSRRPSDEDRAAEAVDLGRVGSWLQPEAIVLDADAGDTEGVLRVAADIIGRAHPISPTLLFDALQRREKAGSTALGAGFAIPHARLPGIDRPVTVFIRLRNPIPFDASDGLPVAYLLVIIVPKDGADGDHLRMLAMISELFSDRGFRKRIGAAADVPTAETVFRSAIAKLVHKAHAGSSFVGR